MLYRFVALLVSFVIIKYFMVSIEAKNETIIKVPYLVGSSWKWSWTVQSPWGKSSKSNSDQYKPDYYACVNPSSEPNAWLRGNVFVVGGAKRVDVTVEYAVSNCSTLSYRFCKESFNLYVYKTSISHSDSNKVPDPTVTHEVYKLFGTTKPNVLTVGAFHKAENTETYSFLTNAATPNYYLAIRYRGGCFKLYGVTVSYSVCQSLALPSGLIQLPLTIAPANGSIQITGSCVQHAQPLANNSALYGYCKSDGEWSTNMYSGECWCDAGYGKYSAVAGPGAECRKCPSGTYQDTASNSQCKTCPLNSTQDTNRTKCKCDARFYRTDKESIFDNCTAQPSAPQNLSSTFVNATFVTIVWSPSLNLGGRSDVYYKVECKQCDDEGKDCTKDCTGAVITHTTRTTRMATVRHLSAYTYYQLKVFAKNGVTHLAEKNNEKSKYDEVVRRTNEGIPGTPVLEIKVLNPTSVLLSWTLQETNGVIAYYQVTYYPVGEESSNKVLNTTNTSIIITGLIKEKKYFFQVRASTSAGLGQSGNDTKTVVLSQKDGEAGDAYSVTPSMVLIVGVVVGVATLFILLIIVAVCLCRRKYKRRSESTLGLTMTPDLIPMHGHRMYVDPSNYGSPMEALLSNSDEIDFHKIKLEKNIGGGEFADVYKGILTTGSNTEVVAVKILKPKSSTKNKEDFILEASIMGQFNHPNVTELKGVVTRSPDSPMMIVTEFMENGSLDYFLKLRDGQLTVLQLLGIARGVADGMAYLSGMNFIHRDLAARNILVADNMASKVADFGLSRELDNSEDNPDSEYQTQGGKIPVRWTAPEAIRYRKFSCASDVWSYGILLWEIMSFSERPYWDWDNFQVMERIEGKYRLPAPMNCPMSIHNIMLDCWEAEKNNRPKFPDIVKRLEDLIRSPEKINDDQNNYRFLSGGAQTNFGEVTSVEDWLVQINMNKYTDNFVKAGFTELDQVKALGEKDLIRMGVRLVGHRNKINKSIKAMNKYYDNIDPQK